MRDNCCSYMLCKNLFDCFSAIQSTAVIAVGGGGGAGGELRGKKLHTRGKNYLNLR